MFNNGFFYLLSAQHPSIYTFINGLRRQQHFIEVKIAQSTVRNPHMPREKTKKAIKWILNVKQVVKDYQNCEFK